MSLYYLAKRMQVVALLHQYNRSRTVAHNYFITSIAHDSDVLGMMRELI